MAVSTGDEANAVVQLCMAAIRRIAERDHIPERLVKGMEFRVDCHYAIERDCLQLLIAWRDPETLGHTRNMTMQIFPHDIETRENLCERILMTIDSINLRGELFFFKLHKHFPNYVERVLCSRDGTVTVYFKNGRILSVSEQDLDSTEFLATCGMVYDL